jgi:hypothetical protein
VPGFLQLLLSRNLPFVKRLLWWMCMALAIAGAVAQCMPANPEPHLTSARPNCCHALQEPEMSAMFDLEHIESCMGGRYPGLLFKLDEYRQRMQVRVCCREGLHSLFRVA